MPSVNKAGDSIALVELGNLATDRLDHAGVVAAAPGSGVGEMEFNVLPVRGIQSHGFDLDQHPLVSQLGDGNVLDPGLAVLEDNDRLVRRHVSCRYALGGCVPQVSARLAGDGGEYGE